jgi:very-short-patch-repair endonuclease
MTKYAIQESLLKQLYWEKGFSYHQIAERLGCSKGAVQHHFNRMKIPRRTPQEAKLAVGCTKPRYRAWNKGLTKETDARVKKYAMSLKGRHFTTEHKRKVSETKKRLLAEGKIKLPSTKGMKIWSVHKHPQLGKLPSEETRRKISLANRKWYRTHPHAKKGKNNPNWGKSTWNKGRTKHEIYSEEILQMLSKKSKMLWENPFYRQKVVQAVLKAVHKKPNKKESELIAIIEKNRLPFKYVGDGKIIIEGRCPDFINNNGGKQIIELYGDYWHRNDNPQERIDFFRRYGYTTLIVWEHELNNEHDVVEKIRSIGE